MIGITAATGQLGQLVVQALLDRGVPATQLVALVRTPEKAAALAAQGVQVRHADYHQPATLNAALQGIEKLLLISSSDFNDRVGQHRHVIEAAREAGVKQVAYTSILNADTATFGLAADHQATEQILRDSGLPFVFLRNGWYTENYTGSAAQAVQNGALLGAAGTGKLNLATRRDYAEAAAVVLATDGHIPAGQSGRTYELAGDESLTMRALAAEYARQSGQPVEYRDLPQAEYAATLQSFGVPEGFAHTLADVDAGIARGELSSTSRDLTTLIGRPTTAVRTSVAEALNS
ncbi:SDR family oxidoreductase [Deinococcus sp. 12RED42]|uniref:SDR family oxidoreductase n=1 Tax=Deinococcus sp. 12RED42 TaxID=2745872 RepID=UPI001E41E0E0|nr:SDR family oxidoreductase [Deinococcus sp. 12RED42]MCD0165327.1 SDR family oxidoreductase [Deinococcus sp. 12RED42]